MRVWAMFQTLSLVLTPQTRQAMQDIADDRCHAVNTRCALGSCCCRTSTCPCWSTPDNRG